MPNRPQPPPIQLQAELIEAELVIDATNRNPIVTIAMLIVAAVAGVSLAICGAVLFVSVSAPSHTKETHSKSVAQTKVKPKVITKRKATAEPPQVATPNRVVAAPCE